MKIKFDQLEKLRKYKSQIIFWIPKIIILLSIVSLINSCTIIEIKENERGVKFEKFNGGLNPDIIYQPGFHIFSIWDRAIVYNVDTLVRDEYLYFNTTDNIQYEINLILTYKLIPDKIGYLENYIGKSYYERVILQEVEHAFSNQFEKQTSNSISSIDINKLQLDIFETVSKPIRKKYIKMISIEINQISKLE